VSEGDWGYKLAQANETIRAANAEIAKLWKERNEAKAEIVRLTAKYEKAFGTKLAEAGWQGALKPDTGEKP